MAAPKKKTPKVKVPTVSFKAGTQARAARGKMAEDLKDENYDPDSAFAIATAATKKMSQGGKKRMARNGLKGST